MFARQRDPGLWTFDSVVDAAEFEAFDENISNALDGLDGGAYSLQEDMEIGGGAGAEWTFNLPLFFEDAAEFNASLTANSSIAINGQFVATGGPHTITGETTFHSNVEFNADVQLGNASTDDVIVLGTALFFEPSGFFDGFEVAGECTFDDDVDIDAHLSADSADVIALAVGSLEVGLTADFADVVSFTASGKLKFRQQVVASDANQTLVAAQVDTFFIPTGVFTTDRQVTIDDTGAEDGMRVMLWSLDTANFCTVRRPDTTGIGSFGGGTSPIISFLERVAGVWYHRAPGPDLV